VPPAFESVSERLGEAALLGQSRPLIFLDSERCQVIPDDQQFQAKNCIPRRFPHDVHTDRRAFLHRRFSGLGFENTTTDIHHQIYRQVGYDGKGTRGRRSTVFCRLGSDYDCTGLMQDLI